MFTKFLQSQAQRHYQCGIQDAEWSTAMKEQRIVDTLEPVLNQHRLIVCPSGTPEARIGQAGMLATFSAASRAPARPPVFLVLGPHALIYRSLGFEWRSHTTDAKVGGQGHTTHPLRVCPDVGDQLLA